MKTPFIILSALIRRVSNSRLNRAINCAYCYTYAMTAYAVKCAAAPNLPNNEGSVAPIKVTAPEASIIHHHPHESRDNARKGQDH